MKKQKNKNLQQYIIFLFYILVGAICGFVISSFISGLHEKNISHTQTILVYVLFILAVYVSLFFQVVIHEAGHLVFGLFTGYKFVSFRIGSLTFVKQNGKIKLKIYSIVGTGGQCIMLPPEFTNDKAPYVLYNLGGCIFNLIASITTLLIYIFAGHSDAVHIFLFVFTITGFAAALVNGIPLPTGQIDNDGKNVILFKKDPLALYSFYKQLVIYAQASNGTRLKDMPDEWFELPDVNELNSPMSNTIAVFASSRLMDQMRFNDARELISKLLKKSDTLSGVHKGFITCDMIYCEMLQDAPENISKWMTKEQTRFMSAMKKDISVLRTSYLIAAYIEKNTEKSQKIMHRFNTACKKHPVSSDVESELALIENMQKHYE